LCLGFGWSRHSPPPHAESTRLATPIHQAMARCNKCGSRVYPRCAARAALDLKNAIKAQGMRPRHHRAPPPSRGTGRSSGSRRLGISAGRFPGFAGWPPPPTPPHPTVWGQ
jgi:hypothetical protein